MSGEARIRPSLIPYSVQTALKSDSNPPMNTATAASFSSSARCLAAVRASPAAGGRSGVLGAPTFFLIVLAAVVLRWKILITGGLPRGLTFVPPAPFSAPCPVCGHLGAVYLLRGRGPVWGVTLRAQPRWRGPTPASAAYGRRCRSAAGLPLGGRWSRSARACSSPQLNSLPGWVVGPAGAGVRATPSPYPPEAA